MIVIPIAFIAIAAFLIPMYLLNDKAGYAGGWAFLLAVNIWNLTNYL